MGTLLESSVLGTHLFFTYGQNCSLQTNILAVKDGVVKSVFYEEKNNVPAYSKVVEFEES